MNEDDVTMSTSVYSYAAGTDTITIGADDVTSIDLSDITINTTPTQSSPIWRKSSINDFLNGYDEKPKASVVYDLDIDPLAAIIELKAAGRFPEVEMIKRHIPSEETNRYAQTIREYYLDKIVTQKLSSTYRDSDFKRDMVKSLKLSGKHVLEEPHIRLLYRLPDFYVEDRFYDELTENYNSFLESRGRSAISSVPLTYIGSFDFYRRGFKAKNFYFKNSDNVVFELSVNNASVLMPITKIFDKIETLVVSGQVTYTKLKGYDFVVGKLDSKYTVEDFTF